MPSKDISDYFKQRDREDPGAKQRRAFLGIMFEIAEGLYRMRKSAGLTQKQLAQKLKTTQSTIARWETPGYDGYTLRKIFDIAEQLDYDVHIHFGRKSTSTITTSHDWIKLVDVAIDRRSRLLGKTINSSDVMKENEVQHGPAHLVSSL